MLPLSIANFTNNQIVDALAYIRRRNHVPGPNNVYYLGNDCHHSILDTTKC